jgi:hypothetical protein
MFRVSIGSKATRVAALTEDDSEDTQAITEGAQVACSVYAGILEAGDLSDNKTGCCHADMDHCFDLKSVTPQLPPALGRWVARSIEPQDVKVSAPEDVEPVAEV